MRRSESLLAAAAAAAAMTRAAASHENDGESECAGRAPTAVAAGGWRVTRGRPSRSGRARTGRKA